MAAVDISRLTPVSELAGEDAEETGELQQLAAQATDFLAGFRWCGGVKEQYEGLSVAGVVGIFLVRIIPLTQEADEWLWVIVGDVPPAYLVTDEAPTPAEALSAYIEEMSAWATAAEKGDSLDELIPVNIDPSPEAAKLLRSRLDFLQAKVLPLWSAEPNP